MTLWKISSISWKKVTLVKVQTATTKQYGNIFGSNILIFILNWCKKGMNDIARWVVNTIVAIMHHFIIGGEKSCFMALSNGNCKVIVYLWKTKHEKYIVDNVTTYRSETVGCSTGPAMILWKRTKPRYGLVLLVLFLCKHWLHTSQFFLCFKS